MVDCYGRWTAESDYSKFPKEKWCDFDYVANYIKEQKYKTITTIENLTYNLIAHFESETEDSNSWYFPTYNDDFMINMVGLQNYIEASGGLKEFDYQC